MEEKSKISLDENISKLIKDLKKTFEKKETNKIIELRASISSNLAVLYWKKENLEDSQKFFLEAIQEYEKLKDNFKLASTKGALGSLYIQLRKFELAKVYTEEAYEYWTNSMHLNERLACLQNFGIIYLKLNEEVKASDYVLEAIKLSMQLQDEEQFAQSIHILLNYFENKKRYDMLLELKKKALEFWEQMSLEERQFKTLIDLGVLSQVLEGFDDAVLYFKKAFNIGYNSGNIEQMYLAEGFLAESFLNKKDIEKAKYTYLQAFKLAVFLNINGKHQNDVNLMRLALLSLGYTKEELIKEAEDALKEAKKEKK
ncbi:MAG: tetratricopeptide repeat protein [Promethearchaeota archaeon]